MKTMKNGPRHSEAALLLACILMATQAGAAHATIHSNSTDVARPAVTLRSPFSRAKLAPLPSTSLVKIASRSHVSETEYTDLRNAIVALLTQYPPKDHYFIGTGRDPAPLVAALEILGGRALAMNFPASNFVGGAGITPELIAKYFVRLIPDDEQRREILSGRRTLVLLDQSNTGKTPNSLAPHFQAYFDKLGSPAKMIKVTFSAQEGTVVPGVVPILTTPFPDVANYLSPPFEGVVSEFPRHVLGSDSLRDLVQRKEYVQYKSAVAERMKRDQRFHNFLVTKLGVPNRAETSAERMTRLGPEEAAEAERLAGVRRLAQKQRRELLAVAKLAKAQQIAEDLALVPLVQREVERGVPATLALLLLKLPSSNRRPAENTITDNARKLYEWLSVAFATPSNGRQSTKPMTAVARNALVITFLDQLETALQERKISSLEYRWLMGHASTEAVMNPRMHRSLMARSKWTAR